MNTPAKMPMIIGLLMVVLVVGTIIFAVERSLRAPSNASGSQEPKQVEITNIGDSAFTVSWTTDSKATGTVLVTSAGKTNRIYYDERDTAGKLGSYISHSITVRDAQPNTLYTFKILSNGRQYQNKDKPYELTTPGLLPANTNGLEPAYGTILNSADAPADDTLVYLTVAGGQKLSALTKPSGIWLIPLNQLRTEDLTTFLPIVERMEETIFVKHPDGDITAQTDTLNDSPVPDMKAAGTYDFRRQNAKTTASNTLALRPATPALPIVTTAPPLPVGGAVLGESTPKTLGVTLATPAQNASLATALPLISGTGVADKFVSITIGITNPMSGSTRVKSDGTWSYTPPKPLAAGKQSVTITTVDKNNKPVALTHTFEVFKSGTQVLGDATPSATLAITQTPTPTTILAATDSPTPTAAEPTSTLAGQEIPISGNELPMLMLLMIGIGLFIGGTAALLW